jgi:hypothetical protein
MAPETSRPVRAFQPGPSRAVTKFVQFAYKAPWQKSVFIGLPAEALAKAGVHPLATFHVVVKFAVLSSQIIKPIQSPEGYCAEPG